MRDGNGALHEGPLQANVDPTRPRGGGNDANATLFRAVASLSGVRRRFRPIRELGPYTVAINSRILEGYKIVHFAISKLIRCGNHIGKCRPTQFHRGQFIDDHGFN
jgi:hypothetical protein